MKFLQTKGLLIAKVKLLRSEIFACGKSVKVRLTNKPSPAEKGDHGVVDEESIIAQCNVYANLPFLPSSSDRGSSLRSLVGVGFLVVGVGVRV